MNNFRDNGTDEALNRIWKLDKRKQFLNDFLHNLVNYVHRILVFFSNDIIFLFVFSLKNSD